MLESKIFTDNGLDVLLSNIELSQIPLIGRIIIDDKLWGRIDVILNHHYDGNLFYAPLLMAFNNISDISEMKIGMVFELPDLDYYNRQINVNNILNDDTIIPGINKSMNNNVINTTLNSKNNLNITLAQPKLQISLKQIDYNPSTGIITI